MMDRDGTSSKQQRHQHVKVLLDVYIAGTLPEEENSLIKDHLEECPACQADLKELEALYKVVEKKKDYLFSSHISSE